jgi:AraC-like DNA-binding protein
MTAREAAFLRRAKDLVDRSYAQPLDVAALARQAHVSPAHFSRRFKEAYGESPHQYVLARRVERAQELLRNTDLRVTSASRSASRASARSAPPSTAWPA